MHEAGHWLIVASVQASIDTGRVKEDAPGGSRNRLQTVTLLDALEEHGFDAAFGGARRDEERARAKEKESFVSGRVRPVGAAGATCRALDAVQRADTAR